MNSEKVDWSSYIDTVAALHELPLDAERHAAVLRQLTHIEPLARRLLDFPLAAGIELAPVFRP
jgi:hypothetical protein